MPPPIPLAIRLTCGLLLLGFGLACGGPGPGLAGGPDRVPSPAAGQGSVYPTAASVVPGTTIRFTTSAPAAARIVWSVQPAQGGSFDAQGTFTAAGPLGAYTIRARWVSEARVYLASTSLQLVAIPSAAQAIPDAAEADAALQTSPDGVRSNLAILGEGEAIGTATNPSGSMANRTGFYPRPPRTGP